MADVGIYCKNANIQARAGSGANATAKAIAATDVYVLDIESYINAATRYNWSDAYAVLSVDVKYILMDCAASLCAINVISNDTSGYNSLGEAQLLINVNWERANEDIKQLIDLKTRDFITGA